MSQTPDQWLRENQGQMVRCERFHAILKQEDCDKRRNSHKACQDCEGGTQLKVIAMENKPSQACSKEGCQRPVREDGLCFEHWRVSKAIRKKRENAAKRELLAVKTERFDPQEKSERIDKLSFPGLLPLPPKTSKKDKERRVMLDELSNDILEQMASISGRTLSQVVSTLLKTCYPVWVQEVQGAGRDVQAIKARRESVA
ncbi:MAG TPA: hypothetical protein VMX95_04755 [Thermodesulfobacteriota bacterium]|nr:hypothetical protein [Thermodesulfobacteriota bacterium]